jgi:hypothetical protein
MVEEFPATISPYLWLETLLLFNLFQSMIETPKILGNKTKTKKTFQNKNQ